jgi:cytochrome c-type biogenesis protein CcmF
MADPSIHLRLLRTSVGYGALVLALPLSVYAAAASVRGARRRYPELVTSAQKAVLGVSGLLGLATLVLLHALWIHDFQLRYVVENSSRGMPRYLLLTALWGGQEGSLLFWAVLLSLYASAVVLRDRNKHRELMPYVVAVLMGAQAFFTALVAFVANPFVWLPFTAWDGYGLSPLLRHPAMVFHPPALYLGFVGLTVPFAFAMAALITRRIGGQWLRITRRWTLVAWLFLSVGIVLGGRWAYDVLGWGGYWGWDPVENASLMPWLTATAFIHSTMVQERKGMLIVWNMALIILTFVLVLFGTFITRSGVIASVHAFAQSTIGPYFLSFIALVLLVSTALLLGRLGNLKGRAQIKALLSRESIFQLNNLLFVMAALAVFLGTVFPAISEIVTGDQIVVGPSFFQASLAPIFGGLLLTMGVIPRIRWGGTTPRKLGRGLTAPLIVAVIVAVGLPCLGIRQPVALVGFALCAFVVGTTLAEFVGRARTRRQATGGSFPQVLVELVRRNRQRYGGYLTHLAVILMAVGILGSSIYKVERTAVLAQGESMTVGEYTLTYEDLAGHTSGDKEVTAAILVVSRGGRRIGVLRPAQDFYPRSQQRVTIPAVRTTLKEDLYVILGGWEEGGVTAAFRVHVNPLVVWIWIGGGLFVAAVLVAVWPETGREVDLEVEIEREVRRLRRAALGRGWGET